ITRYGMTDEFDMVAMETVTNKYLGGDTSLACAPETQKYIDTKVVSVVKEQHAKAKKFWKTTVRPWMPCPNTSTKKKRLRTKNLWIS
ncbi:MAG: hypothetical protein UDH96_06505, partial [Megasphaera elsdenii]|nr:hypothetical protein [Megasphaera elsdenii]